MIEINLVPDVKQELIHAQRVRLSVISLSIVASVIAVAAIVVLGLFYGIEAVRSGLLDNQIKTDSGKLAKVSDINNVLTLQNQLSMIGQLHDSSHVNSRIFGVLIPLSGQGTQSPVSYSSVLINTSTNTVTIEAQTPQYSGLDAFKKTLAATNFQFTTSNNTSSPQKEALASNINVISQSLGIGASNGVVVSFTLTFNYPNELLSPTSQNAQIITPSAANATDSYQGIPTSLFTQKAIPGGSN